MWFCDDLWLVIWVPNSGMAGTIHAVSWHHKLLEVPAHELQQEFAPGWTLCERYEVRFRFFQSLCVGPWAMRVCKCFQHDQRITWLHSTPSCDGQLCSFFIAPHGQPRRTNGVQFNYAVFLAQYGQLGWARAWINAQRLRTKWCAETVDIFGRRRSSSNLILLGSVKHSDWSVQNEFIQHTHEILWTWCWSRMSGRYPLETIILKNSWKSWILLVSLRWCIYEVQSWDLLGPVKELFGTEIGLALLWRLLGEIGTSLGFG